MTYALATSPQAETALLPTLIARAGERAAWRFVKFFAINIRNANTRAPANASRTLLLRSRPQNEEVL
jgi:hypothetical protein